jgi:kanamycin kinase
VEPLGSGVDLDDERARLVWARTIGHPVPEVLDLGRDDHGQVLITRGLKGTGAATGEWLERPRDAVRAIAAGLRALHEKVPVAACPFRTPWVPEDSPDPRAGSSSSTAMAAPRMSLDWNYGEGFQDEFFDAYGVVPEVERIRYYRAAWDGEL